MKTLRDVRTMAVHAGVSYGTLLSLARETEENANLPSLAHMTVRGLEMLYQTLVAIRFAEYAREVVEVLGCK